jgi:hypothetical protein
MRAEYTPAKQLVKPSLIVCSAALGELPEGGMI